MNSRHSPGDHGPDDAKDGRAGKKNTTLGGKNVRLKRSVDMFKMNEAAKKVGEQIAHEQERMEQAQTLSFALHPLDLTERGRRKGSSNPKRIVSSRFSRSRPRMPKEAAGTAKNHQQDSQIKPTESNTLKTDHKIPKKRSKDKRPLHLPALTSRAKNSNQTTSKTLFPKVKTEKDLHTANSTLSGATVAAYEPPQQSGEPSERRPLLTARNKQELKQSRYVNKIQFLLLNAPFSEYNGRNLARIHKEQKKKLKDLNLEAKSSGTQVDSNANTQETQILG